MMWLVNDMPTILFSSVAKRAMSVTVIRSLVMITVCPRDLEMIPAKERSAQNCQGYSDPYEEGLTIV